MMTKFNISKIEYDGIKYIGARQQRKADLKEWLAWLEKFINKNGDAILYKNSSAYDIETKIQEIKKELK